MDGTIKTERQQDIERARDCFKAMLVLGIAKPGLGATVNAMLARHGLGYSALGELRPNESPSRLSDRMAEVFGHRARKIVDNSIRWGRKYKREYIPPSCTL
jgi:hypothetical protein